MLPKNRTVFGRFLISFDLPMAKLVARSMVWICAQKQKWKWLCPQLVGAKPFRCQYSVLVFKTQSLH